MKPAGGSAMRRAVPAAIGVLALTALSALANPIPVPLPASMPLEEMSAQITHDVTGLRADFSGRYTFDYIPTDVDNMMFPVPGDASGIEVRRCPKDDNCVTLPWGWASERYPTILPESPTLPMIVWTGPFPTEGAVFEVDYEHALIQRPGEFIFFYALGTGKYYPLYQKRCTALFDIQLPPSFGVMGVWMDHSPVDPDNYDVEDSRLLITLAEHFGPFTQDLVVSLVLKGDGNRDAKVDGFDLTLWQQHYDPLALNQNTFAMGDWNGDGKIDGGDLAIWQQNYDPIGPGGADGMGTNVPEPTTLFLLGTGLVAGIGVLRRRRGK